jgi:hypothetical protein
MHGNNVLDFLDLNILEFSCLRTSNVVVLIRLKINVVGLYQRESNTVMFRFCVRAIKYLFECVRAMTSNFVFRVRAIVVGCFECVRAISSYFDFALEQL